MKTFILKSAGVLLSACLLVMVFSCSKEDQGTTTPNNPVIEKEVLPQDFTLPETDIPGTAELIIGKTDFEFSMINPLNYFDQVPEIEITDNVVYCIGKDKTIIPFMKFVNSLQLTPEQMQKFKRILLSYWKCKNELHRMLMKSNEEIIAKANEYKNELIRQLKTGEITEKQFKESIEALKLRTKNAIANNPAKQRLIESLKKCHTAYMENIKLLLNKEQWNKWVAWHKNQQNGTGTKNKY
jgi:hypothetical protein